MAFDKVKTQLEKNGFEVSVFETKEEASKYLNEKIDNCVVGSGGSTTVADLDLINSLKTHNTVYYNGCCENAMQKAMSADVYLMSANAIAEDTGEILNIDAFGNRVASSLFGHKKVYMVAGKNKISSNFAEAYSRLRNVVAPKNAKRLNKKTPCAKNADRCYNCDSPDRICNALVVHYKKVSSMDMEIVLVNENLGF